MFKELVSIIVPVYNSELFLTRCIESLLSQTYDNIEIILIDDGSSDDSYAICKNFSNNYTNIKFYSKLNGGVSSARNYGIEKSIGKYILFVDSDDYIDDIMYETLYNNIILYNADISICGKIVEYKPFKKITNDESTTILMDRNTAIYELNSLNKFDMSACDKLFRKSLFDKIEFPYGKKMKTYL